MTSSRRLLSVGLGLIGLLAAGGAPGCAGHEHAPAEVPSPSPVTRSGDRFDVAIPRDTPVVIGAANEDPDDGRYRAFRYDWVAGGGADARKSGRREASEGVLELPAVPERGFLYVDAVHGPPGHAAPGPGEEQKSSLSWKRLGEGIWRLYFKDGRHDRRRDDLVVTVRFRDRQSPAPAPRTPAYQPAARARSASPVGPQPAPQATWGPGDLGRPLQINPCATCATNEHLVRLATENRKSFWIRCTRCNRANFGEPSAEQAESAWNEDNPPPAGAR
jgi:hypothetical protein